MHEFALAESVIVSAEKVAEEHDLSKIGEINIRVGELQQMGMEAFELGLETAMKARGPLAREARVSISVEKAAFECRACGGSWDFDHIRRTLGDEEAELVHLLPEAAHAHVRCPECKSSDFEVSKGRGLWLDSVAGETR
ncbi:hydrogenase nickel incorporation protein HypA [Elusimicrobiota bacterium]